MNPNSKNNADTVAEQLHDLLERHSPPAKTGGRSESHSPASLVKRLGVPDTEHVQALIESGDLVSEGPVNRNDPDGLQRYGCEMLDGIRRAMLAVLVENVIEESDGDPDTVLAAVQHALSTYKKSLSEGGASTTQFSFTGYEEPERPGLLRRAAGAAAVAGAAYGGASYLRGRSAGVKGLLPALKAGSSANIANASRAGERLRSLILSRMKARTVAPTAFAATAALRRFGVEFQRGAQR